MNEYIKAHELADKWDITIRQVQLLCKQERIKGAIKFGNTWAIPKNVEKPLDLRKRINK